MIELLNSQSGEVVGSIRLGGATGLVLVGPLANSMRATVYGMSMTPEEFYKKYSPPYGNGRFHSRFAK